MLLRKGKITQDLVNMLMSWPPARRPTARRAPFGLQCLLWPQGPARRGRGHPPASPAWNLCSITRQTRKPKQVMTLNGDGNAGRWKTWPDILVRLWRIIRAFLSRLCLVDRRGFSQERMTYFPEDSKVVYRSKDGKDEKTFDALEWIVPPGGLSH